MRLIRNLSLFVFTVFALAGCATPIPVVHRGVQEECWRAGHPVARAPCLIDPGVPVVARTGSGGGKHPVQEKRTADPGDQGDNPGADS